MTDEKLRSLELLNELIELASKSGRFWRTFGRVVLPVKEFESILERLVEETPIDMKKAQEMLAQRDNLMSDALAKSEKIIDDAIEEASRLVDESEIAKKAKKVAISLRDESDKYVIESLEKFEDHIADLLSQVKKAQSNLISEMERRREEELKSGDK
jgi:hypothetical protein